MKEYKRFMPHAYYTSSARFALIIDNSIASLVENIIRKCTHFADNLLVIVPFNSMNIDSACTFVLAITRGNNATSADMTYESKIMLPCTNNYHHLAF